MLRPLGFPGAAERILAGMERLRGQTAHLIVVTNELFSDGGDYDRDTLRYLEVLAGLNRTLAAGRTGWWKWSAGFR